KLTEYVVDDAPADSAAAKEAIDLKTRAAMQYLMSGHIDEGLAVVRQVLEAVGVRFPATRTRALLALLARSVQLWLRGTDFIECTPDRISTEHLTRIDICFSIGLGLILQDPIPAAYFVIVGTLLALRTGELHRVVRGLAHQAGILASIGVRGQRQAK